MGGSEAELPACQTFWEVDDSLKILVETRPQPMKQRLEKV